MLGNALTFETFEAQCGVFVAGVVRVAMEHLELP